MDWKHLLAYITGTVDQALLLRNEYLVTERCTRSVTNPWATSSNAMVLRQLQNAGRPLDSCVADRSASFYS
jgi:hypothetical protein